MANVRRWKRGSTAPAIADQLLDAAGDPINLSGVTVKFVMGPVAGTATVHSATVVGAATGNVQYSWGTADLAVAGLYAAYWRLEYNGGAIEKLPQGGEYPGDPDYMLIRVTDDLS